MLVALTNPCSIIDFKLQGQRYSLQEFRSHLHSKTHKKRLDDDRVVKSRSGNFC